MGPEVFMDDFERTDWSDGYFGMLGRALVFATRFEASVRALSTLLDLKGAPDALDSEERMSELLKAAQEKKLYSHIERLGLGSGELSTALHAARKARNEVAHGLGLGLDRCLDLLPESSVESLVKQLHLLTISLAEGDRIACAMISILTNEVLPTLKHFNEYPELVATWVCER